MPRKREFASIVVKYKEGMIPFPPVDAIILIVSSRGVSGRPDLKQHRVRLENVEKFCELVVQDEYAFEKIIDVNNGVDGDLN